MYGFQFHPDARAHDIERWWHDNTRYHGLQGAQPLAEQLRDATRLEPLRRAWTERLIDRWIAA